MNEVNEHGPYDDQTFCDLYKDIYGFKPSAHNYFTSSPSDKQLIWNNLCRMHVEEMREQTIRREELKNDAQNVARKLMADNGVDAETAVRWMYDAHDLEDGIYDRERFNYEYCLPYGYDLQKELEKNG